MCSSRGGPRRPLATSHLGRRYPRLRRAACLHDCRTAVRLGRLLEPLPTDQLPTPPCGRRRALPWAVGARLVSQRHDHDDLRSADLLQNGHSTGARILGWGLIHNNPALVAISEARAIWTDRPIGTLVSLGCGRPVRAVESSSQQANGVFRSVLFWATHIFNMAGDTWLTHRTVKALLRTLSPETEYFRFEPIAGDVPLNEHRVAKLQAMLRTTAEYIEHSAQRFEECADSLHGLYNVYQGQPGSTRGSRSTGPSRPKMERTYTLDELEQENLLDDEGLEGLRAAMIARQSVR